MGRKWPARGPEVVMTLAQANGAERRREKRYQVSLGGALGIAGTPIFVQIHDLSVSGALLSISSPPPIGTKADLWISEFGDLEVEVVYAGDKCCGVMFTNPAPIRDRLLNWLSQEVTSKEAIPAEGSAEA
jgi:hypothetical protein